MIYPTWSPNLAELPLVLAGPILRQTTSESVTVWVALKQACQVKLQVYETLENGHVLGRCLFTGERSTVALGKFLHGVAVTARAPQGQLLKGDRIYAYDLRFTVADSTRSAPQTLEQALCSSRFPRVDLSYFAHQHPTFVLPPDHPEDLKLVQGSCRKPQGHGLDALPIVDSLIAKAADQPRLRPHQLFLTGDQIYGDDVADGFLWVASPLGDALLGWEESLPVGRKEPDDVVYCSPQDLPWGQRAEIATTQAGFTAGLRQQRPKVRSHLLSLGEYFASYLLAWSPVCWPDTLPGGRDRPPDRPIKLAAGGSKSSQRRSKDRRRVRRHWDQEAGRLRQFIHTLWKVRRALANIPVYTIFDDHDVSDDWNLNQAWCLRVFGRPLGRRAVQNALLAYALFQGWGNTPEPFEGQGSGAKLLKAVEAWSASQGSDPKAEAAIARYLGMPIIDAKTGLPCFVQQGPVLVLKRHPEAITWHYTVQGPCHEVVVLDTRTWRGYPAEQTPLAPPMLLCPQAFEQQLSMPLRHSDPSGSRPWITLVIAPTNLFGLKVLDWIHRWQLRKHKVFAADVGDAWNVNLTALAELLTTLFEQRHQVVVLSGDIHYGSVIRLSHQDCTASPSTSVLLQLTCSALKNEETVTRILHTRLKDWLLPEKVRHWWGWSHPAKMIERSATVASPQQLPSPDWQCALEWVPRGRSQMPNFGAEPSWLLPPRQRARHAKRRWLQSWFFWTARWFQNGREVVGLNNVALIQFQTGEADAMRVIQDTYWFTPRGSRSIVYSRFESELRPNRTLLDGG